VISAHLPHPNAFEAGQKTAMRNLQILSEAYSITLVAIANKVELTFPKTEFPEVEELHIVPINWARRLLNLLMNIGLPIKVAIRKDSRVTRIVRQLMKRGNFARVHVEWEEMGAYISENLKDECEVTINIHDVLSDQFRKFATPKTVAGKLLCKFEQKRVDTWEKESLTKYSRIQAPSVRDIRLLEKISTISNQSLELVAPDVNLLEFSERHFKRDIKIIFWGAYSREENVEGAIYLVEKILPILNTSQGSFNFKVLLCGANPPERLQRGIEEKAVLTAFDSNDLQTVFSSADMAVLPILRGAGIKIKVLECILAGLPVITTPIGAEGISEIISAITICDPNSPEGIAREVLALVESGTNREDLLNARIQTLNFLSKNRFR